MEQPKPDVVDAVLSLTLAVAAGDDEAVEVLLRSHDPADLAIAGSHVIWRMAAALGQMVEPPRSPPQMIHIFAQAMKGPDQGLGDTES
jgi:phenylpyruvate tautomerase PptA (4-oxalocrotonate tautomerase family)